jgi:hypothetical protein
VVGNCRNRAMFQGTHRTEGAVAVDSTDRNPGVEQGREAVAEGRREVNYCNLGTRMAGVRVDLGAGAACQEDHSNLAGVDKEYKGVAGCLIQAIGRGSRVVQGVGQLGRMWGWRGKGAYFPGDQWESWIRTGWFCLSASCRRRD